MARNKVSNGESLDLVLAAAKAPGSVALIGELVGVYEAGGAIGDNVAVQFCGVWALPKATGAGAGIAQGTKVYYDPGTDKITATAGVLKVAGYVWKTATDADVTVDVRLLG